MMDMMTTTGPSALFPAVWGMHMFSTVLFFVGVTLLILWAAKTWNPGQLKIWGIALTVIGTIACLLTLGVRGAPWGGGQMMDSRMQCMMDGECPMMDRGTDDKDMDMMKHDMGDDMMGMSMNDMAAMLDGKTGDAFDKAFIEGMIPHHQGAIDMARAAQTSAKHEEIKRMADAIISAQQQEIDQMNQWLKDWGYTR